MIEQTAGNRQVRSNGSGAAAILAAGTGCCALGVLAILADGVPWMKSAMTFYRPTGPLSGVTTCAVLVWLLLWVILDWRWRRRNVGMGTIAAALVLLGMGLLLTFPPFADLF